VKRRGTARNIDPDSAVVGCPGTRCHRIQFTPDGDAGERLAETVAVVADVWWARRCGVRLLRGVPCAVAVALAVSGCLGGGTPSGGVIPDLTGSTTADAIAVLQDTGFTHIRTQYKPSATVRPDAVIATDPPAHARVLYSQTVTVVVSSGPIQVR
jgi:hypothetical protein